MGLERRQPSQDFGSIIGDRRVMTFIHVETIGGVSKGFRQPVVLKKLLLLLCELVVLIEILYPGDWVMEGLDNEAWT